MDHICQQCLQPLPLNKSCYQSFRRNIPVADPKHKQYAEELEEVAFLGCVPDLRMELSLIDFSLLEDYRDENRESAELFDIISGSTEINHPLCDECADSLFDVMDKDQRVIQNDCFVYETYLERLKIETKKYDIKYLTDELNDLTNEEQRLWEDLKALQEEEKQIDDGIAEAEREKETLRQNEARFWKEFGKDSRELSLAEDDFNSLEHQLKDTRARLRKLKEISVYNTTFHIRHKGHIGIINNFRLGRLPPKEPVDLCEINAAWGQATLLLLALARKCDFTFQKYGLVPFGNHSCIEVLADHTELPLYSSGGVCPLRNRKFDSAMMAFADCLQQFKEEMDKRKRFTLPYNIKTKEMRIEDSGTGVSYPITLQFNLDEQWTKAMKMMLTNLQWALAGVSSQFCNK